MRQASPAELAVLASDHYVTHARVLVADADGIERDLTDLAGHDWLHSADWGEDVDQPIVQPRIRIRREDTGTGLSLSPFDESSPLNRRANGSYAPLIDAGRRIRILTATVPPGSVPAPGDWREVFDGEIDEVEWQTDPMLVVCRDPGGKLQDTIIEDPQDYSSESGVLLHVVMQQLLDDVLGPGVVTLHVPDPPAFVVTRYKPDEGPLLEALQACAGAIGWDVRYVWSETSQAFELTLIRPDREKSVPDHVFGPDDYIDVNRLAVSRADVRNVVEVRYQDSTTHQEERVTVQDDASIARYGRRFMRITEGEDSPIDTAPEALAMAEAALLDLAEPKAEQEIELRYWWPAELGDLYRFTANGVHYTTDQVLAVVGIRHHLSEGRQRTTLLCRGRPSGGYLTWLKRARRPVESTTTLYAQCLVTLVETHPDHLIFEVAAEPDHGTVKLAALDGATLIDGPAAGTAAPSGTQWTIGRPDPESGQGLATWRAEAPGYVGDDQPMAIAEQGRDTVALVMRATVVGQTAGSLTVRVAVADPLGGQGLPNGVTIVAAGQNVGEITWPGKGPLTPWASIPVEELTSDIDTTGHVDFTIARASSGSGSVTWTASALDFGPPIRHVRVQATDTQVVPEVVRVQALPPTCTIRLTGFDLITHKAELTIDGADWQGDPAGLQYEWLWFYSDEPAPFPLWPDDWEPLPPGGAVHEIDVHPARGIMVLARVKDAEGRISPEGFYEIPAIPPFLDRTTGLIDRTVPTSDGKFLEDTDGSAAKASAAEAAAKDYADQVAEAAEEAAKEYANIVIRSGSEPTTRPDSTPLRAGDIWLDSSRGDLPHTWTGTNWRRMYTVINGGDIETGTVDTDQLAANAVTAAKIQAGAVTAEKLDVDTLSAVTADLGEVTAGRIRGADDGLVVDADERIITVRDQQVVPVERVRLGRLGAGVRDYGLQIFAADGRLVLDADGNVGSVVNIPKKSVIVPAYNGQFWPWPYDEDIKGVSVMIAYVGGGITWDTRDRWGPLLSATRDNDGKGSATGSLPDGKYAIKPVFRGRVIADQPIQGIEFDAYLMALSGDTTTAWTNYGPGQATDIGEYTALTDPTPADDLPGIGDNYKHHAQIIIEPNLTWTQPWEVSVWVGVEVSTTGAGGPWTLLYDEWYPIVGHGAIPRQVDLLMDVPAPGLGGSNVYWRLQIMDLILQTANFGPLQGFALQGLSVSWEKGLSPSYASATPTDADQARFLVMVQR